jgi:hypothetical protein
LRASVTSNIGLLSLVVIGWSYAKRAALLRAFSASAERYQRTVYFKPGGQPGMIVSGLAGCVRTNPLGDLGSHDFGSGGSHLNMLAITSIAVAKMVNARAWRIMRLAR